MCLHSLRTEQPATSGMHGHSFLWTEPYHTDTANSTRFSKDPERHLVLSASSFSYRELLLPVTPRYRRYSRIPANARKTPSPLKPIARLIGPCPNGSGTAPARTAGAAPGRSLRRGRSLRLSLRVSAGNGAHPAAHGELQPGGGSRPRRLSRPRRAAATPRRELRSRTRRRAPHLAWGSRWRGEALPGRGRWGGEGSGEERTALLLLLPPPQVPPQPRAAAFMGCGPGPAVNQRRRGAPPARCSAAVT